MSDYWYAGGGIGLGPRPAVPPAEPYPAPVVSSRDGAVGPSKTAVAALVKLAEAHGWVTEVTYAKGSFPHASTGRPGAPKESLAVRMARGTERAVAVYVGGSTWSWGTLVYADRHREVFRRFDQVTPFQKVLLPVGSA
jgi:hypothetical protein